MIFCFHGLQVCQLRFFLHFSRSISISFVFFLSAHAASVYYYTMKKNRTAASFAVFRIRQISRAGFQGETLVESVSLSVATAAWAHPDRYWQIDYRLNLSLSQAARRHVVGSWLIAVCLRQIRSVKQTLPNKRLYSSTNRVHLTATRHIPTAKLWSNQVSYRRKITASLRIGKKYTYIKVYLLSFCIVFPIGFE